MMVERGAVLSTISEEMRHDVPTLERIHELAGHVQTFAHQAGLVAHCIQGIAKQTDLVLGWGGSSHAVGHALFLVEVVVVVTTISLRPSPADSCDSGLPVQVYRQGGAAVLGLR